MDIPEEILALLWALNEGCESESYALISCLAYQDLTPKTRKVVNDYFIKQGYLENYSWRKGDLLLYNEDN